MQRMMYVAFWSIDLDIYIFTISMSHDLRVSSLAELLEVARLLAMCAT